MLPFSVFQLLNDAEDTERFNLPPLYFRDTFVPLELGNRPFLAVGREVRRARQCIYPDPMPELALPSEIPSGNSGYWISLLQCPKPASRACLTSVDFLLRADWEVSVHTLRLKGCPGRLCRSVDRG